MVCTSKERGFETAIEKTEQRRRTAACVDVTRVGKLWYLSCMSLSRYSVLCCAPHGILYIQTSSSALMDATCARTTGFLLVNSPFGVAQYAPPPQNGNHRSGRRVERDDQSILHKRGVWRRTVVLVKRHHRIDTVRERGDGILLKHELGSYFEKPGVDNTVS